MTKPNATVDQLRMEAEDPTSRLKKRILGLKRRVSPTPRMCDDFECHPKKLSFEEIVSNNKNSELVNELYKQDEMIKTQGHDLTKKYQLLHSDLGKLLRSTSGATNRTSSNSPKRGVPNRAVRGA